MLTLIECTLVAQIAVFAEAVLLTIFAHPAAVAVVVVAVTAFAAALTMRAVRYSALEAKHTDVAVARTFFAPAALRADCDIPLALAAI